MDEDVSPISPASESDAKNEASTDKPKRSGKRLAALIVGAFLLFLLVSWRLHDAVWLFNLLLPYAQSIGGAVIAAIVLKYKDLKSYSHPYYAMAALGAIFLFSGLTALNTFKERQQRDQEKKNGAHSIEVLTGKIDDTKDRVSKNAEKTNLSLLTLASDLKEFKEEVRPKELREEMANVGGELTKTQTALAPPPKIDLVFTFVPFSNPPLGPGSRMVASTETRLPVGADGVVHVPFTVFNPTDIVASDGELTLKICAVCKFAKEPAAFRRLDGQSETERSLTFERVLTYSIFPEMAVDVLVPADINRFETGVLVRCRNCNVSRNVHGGIVHLLRDFVGHIPQSARSALVPKAQ